jgi:hypothetical protein
MNNGDIALRAMFVLGALPPNPRLCGYVPIL